MNSILAILIVFFKVSVSLPQGCHEVLVELQEECHQERVQECHHHQVSTRDCGKMTRRECHIVMAEVWTPSRVTRCISTPRLRSHSCENRKGQERCRVSYETSCSTKNHYRNVTEDYPDCKTENVSSCDEDTNTNCEVIRVNRCEIRQRTVRKVLPETRCRRYPVRRCIKVPCDLRDEKPEEKCQDTIVLVKSYHPKERCELVKTDDCQRGPGKNCQDTVKTVCVSPTKNNKVRQMECNGTLIFNNP